MQTTARPRRVVVSLTLGALAYAVMQMMVVPALPAIQRDLDAGPDAVAWLISAFLLSTAVATPVAGRLGDIYGKERALLAVLALFAAGSVVGALATSLPAVVAARVLQGIGGAVFPLAFGIARDVLPRERVPLAVGIISGSFGVGGSLGLVLAGPLVDRLSWHAIFWAGLVMPVVAFVCVCLWVPRSGERRHVRVDWLGAMLLAAGLTPLLLAISRGHAWGWGSPSQLICAAAGVATLAAWGGWELRSRAPLIDLRLLARRSIWPADVIVVAFGFTMYATGYLVPQFVQADPLQLGFGFSADVTGASLVLLPAAVSAMVGATLAGALGARVGSKLPLLLGAATMTVGFAVLAFAHDAKLPFVIATAITHGLGLNLALTSVSNTVVAAAPAGQTGEVAGTNAALRTIGGAVGSQVVATLILFDGDVSERGFTIAFAVCGAVAATALLVGAVLIPRQREI